MMKQDDSMQHRVARVRVLPDSRPSSQYCNALYEKTQYKYILKKEKEVTLDNMRHLNHVKEYSVTKVNLKEIGSVSSTVTITAWAAAVLIVLLVTATCCKCCAPCQTIGTAVLDLSKCLFGGMWSLCKCLIGQKKSQPSGV